MIKYKRNQNNKNNNLCNFQKKIRNKPKKKKKKKKSDVDDKTEPLPNDLPGVEHLSVQPSFRCNICDLECSSRNLLLQHANGKKHKRKLATFVPEQTEEERAAAAEAARIAAEQLKQQQIEERNQQLKDKEICGVEFLRFDDDDSFKCFLCNVDVPTFDVLLAHAGGQRHKKKVRVWCVQRIWKNV